MNSILSNLINDRSFYSVMIQYKDINEDGQWINCGGEPTIMGNQINKMYSEIRKEFVKRYLRDFRFNHIPLRIGFFSEFQGAGTSSDIPIISEYADKRLVRFAMTIPDFYEDSDRFTEINKELENVKDHFDYLENTYPRLNHQSNSLKSVLKKISDLQSSIANEELLNSTKKADLNLDNYVENFLKLYDKGGIFIAGSAREK